MSPVVDQTSALEPTPASESKSIGIIYPPPEVRNIVDKTASFVARNGPEFETRIKQNEINNPKFNFLNSGDPYHGYYQHRVKELKEGKPASGPPQPAKPRVAQPDTVKQRQSEILRQVQGTEKPVVELKDPPPDFEFMADPPSISAFDLDVVKLTAQFVARNGRQFLTNLMNREQRNYQFDFLRPQHSLFQYFTKLLEQYTKVLIPPKDVMKKLQEESSSEKLVMKNIKYRVDWIKHIEEAKRKQEEKLEKERISYAQIDWHDFVVVETVDYQPWEAGNFPPPTTPQEVGARVLMQRRVDEGVVEMQMESDEEEPEPEPVTEGADTQVQDMDEDSSDEEVPSTKAAPPTSVVSKTIQSAPPVQLPPSALPTPGQVVIKKYNPKEPRPVVKTSDAEYLISPITGEKIPANKVQEHMRIGLLDPRWVEERDRQIASKASEEQVFAAGGAIEDSLKQLAERRTDIFGVGDEAAQETAIGKKMGEEEQRKSDNKVTWDGYSSSAEAAARAARANISLQDQIEQIHRQKGLIQDQDKEKIGPKSGIGAPATVESLAPQLPPAPIPAPPKSVAPGIPMSRPMANVPPPVSNVPQMPPRPVIPGSNTDPRMAHVGMPGQPVQVAPPPAMPPLPMMMTNPAVRPPMMVPPRPVFMPPRPPMPFAAMPQPSMPQEMASAQKPDEDEPPSKKQRTEESLIPESEFMARNLSPVMFKVSVPKMADKAEWRLDGQTLTMSLHLTDAVSVIKRKIHEETGMPPGKQKLQWESIFFKDSNTLAYYNVTPGTVIYLQVKERGGRKK